MDKFRVKRGAETFPLMVVVAVAYVCNAKCPNCPYTQSTIRESYKDRLFMHPKTFVRIADECGKYGAYVRISGGGEPLLHPQMLTLIEYAKKAGAGVGLITNGSRLGEAVNGWLLYSGIDAIEVSVDAADAETYVQVRPGLNFNSLVSNVRSLIVERNRLKAKTKIIVSVINQKAVEGKIPDIARFWKEDVGVDNIQVRKFLTWGIGDEKQSADTAPYIPDHRTPCPFPFERLNVDSRGKIEFCGFDIAGETDFGNVTETSIEEVWQGEKFTAWRKLLLEGRYEDIPICAKCPDWRYRSWEYNYWNVLKKAER